MPKLFEPLSLRELTLKNRIAMSPMCQYSATDGYVNQWHEVHYPTRAVGGVGLIVVEATAVSPVGRITPTDLGIWDDTHVPGLEKLAGAIERFGAVPAIQLAHAGRKASHDVPWQGGTQLSTLSGGWETIAPSSVPFAPNEVAPVAMGLDDIETVITQFRNAALRALRAGFKVAEIHAAHGYLLHQFLSPISNQRTDDYGGTFENRTRLVCEVAKEVRAVWPDGWPVFIRLSATDWADGGWDLPQTVMLASLLKPIGIDLVDCSSGGNLHDAQIPVQPGYQVPFASEIRAKADILTGAVGLIGSALQAEAILQDGAADLVLLGRELLRNPYFALHAAKALNADLCWPNQYLRGK